MRAGSIVQPEKYMKLILEAEEMTRFVGLLETRTIDAVEVSVVSPSNETLLPLTEVGGDEL